jgi:hypothetical protein
MKLRLLAAIAGVALATLSVVPSFAGYYGYSYHPHHYGYSYHPHYYDNDYDYDYDYGYSYHPHYYGYSYGY